MTPAGLLQLAACRAACGDGSAQRICLDAQVSVEEIAAACGVEPVQIALWEEGVESPSGPEGLTYAALLIELSRVGEVTP